MAQLVDLPGEVDLAAILDLVIVQMRLDLRAVVFDRAGEVVFDDPGQDDRHPRLLRSLDAKCAPFCGAKRASQAT